MDVTATIKFTETEIKILINSLEHIIDTESIFTGMPENYKTLLEDLNNIKVMIEKKKHSGEETKGNELYDDLHSIEVPNPKKEYMEKITGDEEKRNGPEACDNCED